MMLNSDYSRCSTIEDGVIRIDNDTKPLYENCSKVSISYFQYVGKSFVVLSSFRMLTGEFIYLLGIDGQIVAVHECELSGVSDET